MMSDDTEEPAQRPDRRIGALQLGRGSGCALHNGCSARPDHTFDPFLRAESDRLVAQAYLPVRDLHVAQDLAQRTLEHSPRS